MPLIKFSSELIFELVAVLKSSISLVFDSISNFLSPSATPLADITCVLVPIYYLFVPYSVWIVAMSVPCLEIIPLNPLLTVYCF